ncbi:MAG: carboxypeptidase regulatory-like domain-containing protein [Gammaproteobacteria bacterium]|nr:carboxypeptidase regulatory-like domain-containing protein [Gammaproteobacteria bacterium]
MLQTRSAIVLLTALTASWLYVATMSTVSAAGGSSLKLDMWRPGDPGQRLLIRGRVSSETGAPVANATLHIRQADGSGVYTEQYQGSLQTGSDGSYAFGTVLPGQYSSTKHIHVFFIHDDYSSVNTLIRFKGDPNLAGGAYDDNAIVTEEATIDGARVLLGEFNIVLQR